MAAGGSGGTPLGNLVVNLSLNGSQFTNSLTGIRGDLRLAQSAMRANLSVLGEAGNEYNRLSQHISDLGRVMQVNQRQIDELRRKHQQAIDTYGEGSTEAQRYAVQINRVVTQQANFERQLRQSERALEDLNNQDTRKLQNSMRQLETHLGRLREHAEEVSQALGQMAVPATAFSGFAIAAEDELDKVRGLLGAGLGLSKEESRAAGEVAGRIYSEGFGESLTDVGNTYKMVTQFMQLSGTEAEHATKLALGYAEATGDDVQEALRGADALMKHYGMTAQEAFDYLTKGAQNGLNKSNELADNTAEYAQLFKEGGFSAQQMFSILDGGLQSGAYNLDKVNDFVKEFGVRLADGSFEDKMGSLSKETQGMFKSWKEGKATTAEVFASFQKDLQGLGDNGNKTKSIMADMFGGMGEDNALQVIEGLSMVSDEYENVAGTADEANKAMRDTNSSNIKEGWRKIQAAIRPVGEDLMEFAGNVLPKVASAASVVSEWFQGLGDKGKFISLAIGGLGAVAPIVAAVFVVLAGAMASFGSAIAGIMASGILTGLVSAITSIIGISALVVAAIVALIFIFKDMWKTSETFREIVKKLVEVLKDLGKRIKDTVVSAAKTLVDIFKTHVLPVLKDFYKFVKENIIIVLGRLMKFWDDNGGAILGFIGILKKVVSFLTSVLAPIFGVVFKAIFTIVKGYITNVINIALSIIDIFSGVIKFFTGIFTGNLSKAWEGIKEIFRGAVFIILNLLSMFFIGKILSVFKGFASSAMNLIKSMWSKVTGFFSSGLGKVRDLTQSAKNKIVDIFGLLGTSVIRKFDEMVTNVKKVPQKIMDGFSSAKTKLVNKMSEIGNAMKNGLIGGLNGMINGVNWVLEKLGLSKFKISLIPTTVAQSTSSVQRSASGYVPRYHNGTGAHGHRGGLAMVNDSKGPLHEEAIILPNGQVKVLKGKDLMVDLPKGSHVIPGHATPDFMKRLGIPKYEKGTGLWEKVKNIGSGVWDALTDPISFFKKMISNLGDYTSGLTQIPKQIVKGAFGLASNKATDWFKNIMNSDEAQQQSEGGPAKVTSGKISGRWGVVTELMSLATKILPSYNRAVITSGLRPGSLTETGTLSDHGRGKALDVSGYGRVGHPMYRAMAEEFFKSPYVNYVIANNQWKKKNSFGWKHYPWGGHNNHVHVSAFANGGIVDKPTMGIFGEAGKEALIPLSSSRRSRGVQLLNEAANHLGKQVVNEKSSFDSDALLNATLEQNKILLAILTKDSDIYLDKTKVGKTIAPTVKSEIETMDKREKRTRGLT